MYGPIECVTGFDIYILVGSEWEHIMFYDLDEYYIPTYLYDEQECQSSNQKEINKKMQSIINEIKDTGTLMPPDDERMLTQTTTIYMPEMTKGLLKIEGCIGER